MEKLKRQFAAPCFRYYLIVFNHNFLINLVHYEAFLRSLNPLSKISSDHLFCQCQHLKYLRVKDQPLQAFYWSLIHNLLVLKFHCHCHCLRFILVVYLKTQSYLLSPRTLTLNNLNEANPHLFTS